MSSTTRIRVKTGGTAGTVEVKGPSAADLEAAVRKCLGAPLAVLEREVGKVHTDLKATWPVKTGESRDSFYVAITLQPEKYRATVSIVSDDEKVRYIKTTKHGKKNLSTRLRSPIQTDVRQPVAAIKKEHKAELDAAIRTALTEVLRGR